MIIVHDSDKITHVMASHTCILLYESGDPFNKDIFILNQ